MTNKINRKQILEEFLENISCLADKNYQERIWIRAEGPECDDIDDAVCNFFDEGEFILDKHRDFEITNEQLVVLMKLHDKLRFFTDTYGVYYPHKSTDKLIKMPEWEAITEMAKEVLKAFNYKKTRH